MMDIEKGAIPSEEKEVEELARAMCPYSKDSLCRECSEACFYKDYAKRAIDKGWRKQSEWISVEERLPEVRQRVLLYSCHDGVNMGYRADEIGRFYVDKVCPYRPTHWMTLPDAPKGGAE